jgi:hypothetical protein
VTIHKGKRSNCSGHQCKARQEQKVTGIRMGARIALVAGNKRPNYKYVSLNHLDLKKPVSTFVSPTPAWTKS